ncbi:uncharacterized protein LOC117505741 isoform X2 [Thalassophryne amazonica]|nr:uncharacterized protein LOC117505741 isoform X2 [Thalassophryne amazonica]
MECELCKNTYNFLRQHLVKGHGIRNKQELNLLMISASGRGHKGKIECPMCKSSFSRLDKHLRFQHKDLPEDQRKDLYRLSVKKKVLQDLHELRASLPVVTMVSTLDLTEEELSKDVPPDPEPPKPSSGAIDGPSSGATAGPSSGYALSCPGCRVREEAIRRLRMNNTYLRANLVKFQRQTPRKKHQRKRKTVDEEDQDTVSGYEKLLSKFHARIITRRATTKEASNVQQRVQSVRQFLLASSRGSIPRRDLLHLRDHSRITEAADAWKARGLAPTTVKKKLIDTSEFFTWVGRAWPEGVRLSERNVAGIRNALSRELKNIAGSIVTHVVSVRRKKSDKVLPVQVHRAFLKKAIHLLPKFFNTAVKTKKRSKIQQFLALLAGMIVGETGHRITVLKNMMASDVEEAKKNGRCYVIYVKEHKTRRTFVDARVPVDSTTFGIMKSWLEAREKLRGWSSKYLFSSSSGGRAPLLLEDFKRIWLDLGFPGPSPTFNGLRSSMATHVSTRTRSWYVCMYVCF